MRRSANLTKLEQEAVGLRASDRRKKPAKHVCPDCKNTFAQPFKCATCGAERLYDETLKSAQAEIARMRPVFKAAMRWYNASISGKQWAPVDALQDACARAERKVKK